MYSIDGIVYGIVDSVDYIIGLAIVLYIIFGSTVCLCCLVLLVPLKFFTIFDKAYRTPVKSSGLSANDVAVITGGSRGLGAEMVSQMLRTYGVGHIFILDKIEPEILDTKNITYMHCDVGNKDTLIQKLEEITHICEQKNTHISVFINNAGMRHHHSLLQIDDESITTLYNVNVFSFIWGVRYIVKDHIARSAGKPLSIVTVSSVLGHLAPKNLSIYSSTKAALTQAHEGLAEELSALKEIRMLAVLPGQLSTGMFDDVKPSRVFFAPIVDSRELAAKILYKVSQGECGVLSEPLYGHFLPLVKCLPYSLIKFCRWFSEMDQKVKDA